MKTISLKDLLASGCHFGHQVNRWNPKAKGYIYASKDHVHIIDLAQTKTGIEEAGKYVKEMAGKGAKIIFLGTKRQAKKIIEESAKEAGAMYMAKRWIGGLFTNWEQIDKNLKRLHKLEEDIKSEEERKKFTKFEVTQWEKEYRKLMDIYGGIYDLEKIPELIYIVDIKKELSAVKEAIRTGVSIVALTDTNVDPALVDYPIPANDDAVASIRYITEYISQAYKEGRELFLKSGIKKIEDK